MNAHLLTACTPGIELSVCIVNHQTPELTLSCLRSLRDTARDMPVDIMVVNNTPDAGQVFAASIAEIPGVKFFQNQVVRGFAANQNAMLERAVGRYLMPLNSDTVVLGDALRTLVAFMDAYPGVAIAGPKLLNADGSLQPSARHFATPFRAFMEVSGLWRLFKHQEWLSRELPMCHPHDQPLEVDWLSGACYIVRREAIQAVGLYDEDTFTMYGEDLDWCWRLRAAGWKIMLCDTATIIHFEQRSPLIDRQGVMWRNSLKADRKTGRGRALIPVYLAAVLGLLIRLPFSRSRARARENLSVMRLLMAEVMSLVRHEKS